MACWKPVVATNTKDFKALEQCNAGLLVDSEDHEEVANAIQTLLKDKELSKRMGINARKCVVENHSWERVAMKVAEVCRENVFKEY
jgi:glycosyltransferase involved in cell wall biosynthesis